MIARFFTTSVSVSRLSWVDDSGTESVASTITAHVQQASAEVAQQLGNAFGEVFTLWTSTASDVIPGDTLTVATGAHSGTYTVKAVMDNLNGTDSHKEVVAIKEV